MTFLSKSKCQKQAADDGSLMNLKIPEVLDGKLWTFFFLAEHKPQISNLIPFEF